MFMLIIWLQGIWLPLHGYDFARTPLWAGIYMLPLTLGFLIAGPISGIALGPLRGPALRHRRDALHGRRVRPSRAACRSTSATGRSLPCCSFMGLSNGLFMSPNRAGGDEQPPGRTPRRRVGNDRPPSRTRPRCSRSGSSSRS